MKLSKTRAAVAAYQTAACAAAKTPGLKVDITTIAEDHGITRQSLIFALNNNKYAGRREKTTAETAPIAETVKRLRLAAGCTQDQLAEMLGVKKMAISRLERGQTVPRLATAVSLANTFRVSIDDLLSGADSVPFAGPLEMPDGATFGAALRQQREKLKITQPELARKANVTQSNIQEWENGSRWPLSEPLFRVARVLGVAVDYLLKKR